METIPAVPFSGPWETRASFLFFLSILGSLGFDTVTNNGIVLYFEELKILRSSRHVLLSHGPGSAEFLFFFPTLFNVPLEGGLRLGDSSNLRFRRPSDHHRLFSKR